MTRTVGRVCVPSIGAIGRIESTTDAEAVMAKTTRAHLRLVSAPRTWDPDLRAYMWRRA